MNVNNDRGGRGGRGGGGGGEGEKCGREKGGETKG